METVHRGSKAFFLLDTVSFPKGGVKEGQDLPHIGIPIFAQSLLEQAKGAWQQVMSAYGVAIHSPGMLRDILLTHVRT